MLIYVRVCMYLKFSFRNARLELLPIGHRLSTLNAETEQNFSKYKYINFVFAPTEKFLSSKLSAIFVFILSFKFLIC